MNVRRSAHVVLTWHPSRSAGDATAFALITGERVALSRQRVADLLEIPADEFVSRDEDWVVELCRQGLLLTDGSGRRSVEHRRREAALDDLGWDFESAFFHLAKRLEGSRGELASATDRSSQVFQDRVDSLGGFELPPADRDADLYRLLLRRSTARDFDDERGLSIEDLAVLLRYVWGAHAHGLDSNGSPVVKKTSPSGGSLHPLEVYPLLRRVPGVEPGLYHYSVRLHALELIERIDADAVRDVAEQFTAGQDWFAEAHALFLITARFERAYRKYRRDPGTYQSLLLEAGHFSQTFYLVATELGLGPFVTSVINHVDIDRRLRLDPYREGVLLVCGCGVPAATSSAGHDRPFIPRQTELEL